MLRWHELAILQRIETDARSIGVEWWEHKIEAARQRAF